MFGLFDAVALVQSPFDWDRVLAIVEDPLPAASLEVLLACVAPRGSVAVPRHVSAELRRRHRLVGRSEIAVLASLVDGYLLGAKRFRYFNTGRVWTPLLGAEGSPGLKTLKLPWYVAFPPTEPRRFQIAYQWDRVQRWASGK